MPLHPQAERFLKTWNSLGEPPMETQPVDVVRRSILAASGLLKGCPELARLEERRIPGPRGDIRIKIYTPFGPGPFGIALYFHGGGWVLNSIDTHDDLVRRLTDAAGCVFVSVDYRLAPEHEYPAAVEDGYAAVQWVAAHARELNADPDRIAVVGDSAGSNVAAVACLMARDQHGPAIRHQTLAYPITDCDLDRPSYHENADGYFLTLGQMRWFWDLYCPDVTRRTEAYVSPLRAASLRGLPPALIFTAEYDPLRDEGEAYAAALQAAGVPTTLRRFDGLIHAYLRRVETFDAAGETIRTIGAKLRTAFAQPMRS
ncbi:MAG: alpha/beta hydrolase [Planctomycetaceae bacterium]|nr:alpha/beta hydrolase [Planctomycetaceae bacterium]